MDFDEKGAYNQSYSERDFFCLKPSKRWVVTLLKLQKTYILRPI